MMHTARISLLASAGHVITSIVLAGVIAVIGLQFRATFETQQGHIVGIILVATGLGFLIWTLTGHAHHEHGHEHGHEHEQEHERDRPEEHGGLHTGHTHSHEASGSLASRVASIAVPFGAAASPDLTILPIALAASGIGAAAVAGVLVSFSAVTLATFVILTVAAAFAGYQIRGEWLENNGMLLTAAVLIVIGVAVFVGL
jgi:VIT1/CCC1 family predicted Fe2+/Mn2+ transporter